MTNTLNNILSKDIANSYAPMGRAEEVECIIEAKAGNHIAQNKLVNSQLKRIVSIARTYSNHTNSVQDLISEGTIGLIHAITMYDLEKANDIRFHSYAQWWIREHIGNYVCDNQLVVLPRNQSKGKKKCVMMLVMLLYHAKKVLV
jgi:DNA-directed RNA polymerase sigma subunit (sigma70/sigma32)